MKILKFNLYYVIILILLLLHTKLFTSDIKNEKKVMSIDCFDPIVPFHFNYHREGTLWNRITNIGKIGDDAYSNRTPSCDWPGGSQNSYLYRGSIWLTARVAGQIHCTQVEDSEFSPIDSVHVVSNGLIADRESFTKYYDVNAPLASDHFPLGIEVLERTYAWSDANRDDFIIYEFHITNVGIDTNGDGYPDTPRDLNEFYFTFRLDGDVSKQPYWDAEHRFVNQDDHAVSNASWDWINLFPDWASVNHGLTDEDADSSMVFMWDGDNPAYPAWTGGPDDDTGNPSVTGILQSPGFLGFKVIKTEPAIFKVSSYHTTHIYNEPVNDQEAYDRIMSQHIFEDLVVHPVTGNPFPNDYRGYLTMGPMDTLFAGQTISVIGALSVGCHPDSGGIYSLMELVSNMETAEYWVGHYGLPNSVHNNMPSVPVTPELKQNYPNPFNASTTIKYTLPKSENVKIEIFNLLGQKMETLLNKKMSAGVYEVEFNAKNLASGVYLYRIDAGDFHKVRKMILLK